MKDKIKEVFLHYGYEIEKNKAIEELSELIIGIVKGDRKNIIEEIADVEIVIQHIKFQHLIEDCEVDDIKDKKIDRQLFKMKTVN